MKNTIQVIRLVKLATHLSHVSDLQENEFVFLIRFVNDQVQKLPFFQKAICESMVVSPDDFEYRDGEVVWKEDYTEPAGTLVTAMMYYRLNLHQIDHCFTPGMQDIPRFGGRYLTKTSGYHDIAYNIICMLKKLN